MKPIALFVICLTLIACSSNPSKETIFSITEAELKELQLSYYSDYYSFIGWDDQGMVAFAIDNNRGRDGDTWQADHFVVMYDEHQGWQDIQGNGAYDNVNQDLLAIPNSEYFSFSKDETTPTVIKSPVNELELRIEAEEKMIKSRAGLSRYELGASSATLTWKGRVIRGRVIHEYLFLPAFNRLSRTYLGLFNDFHGIYAVVDRKHDFYFHLQDGDFLEPLTGGREGFLKTTQHSTTLNNLSAATQREFAWGFYRWPSQWRGKFTINGETYEFELENGHPHKIANWIIGGFSMGIVKGKLTGHDTQHEVVGISELIM